MKRRIKRILNYLKSQGFQTESLDLQSIKSDKYTGTIKKEENEYILDLVLDDKLDKKRMFLKEVRILKSLEKSFFTPRIIIYSEKELFLVREQILGKVCGNVYYLDEKIINEKAIEKIVQILINLWFSSPKIKLPTLKIEGLVRNINSIKFEKIEKNLIQKISESLFCIQNNRNVFLHGDIQPTNIIKSGQKFFLIDFEKAQKGTIYYDFASFFHRLDCAPKKQDIFLKRILKEFQQRNIKFNPLMFNLFYAYYLIIDIVSLDEVYIKQKHHPYHDTILEKKEAKKLQSLFIDKLNDLKLSGSKNENK